MKSKIRRRNIIFGLEVFLIIVLVVVVFINLVKIVSPEESLGSNKNTYTDNRETSYNNKTVKEANYSIKKPKNISMEQARKIIKRYSNQDTGMRDIYKNIGQYPENLVKALANNPEMKEFVLGYEEKEHKRSHLTNNEKKQKFPLFIQWDERWGYDEYGDDNIGLSGCGPTALSMVIYSLTKNADVTPNSVAEYSMNNGYYVENIGTAWALMTEGALHYGVNAYEISLDKDVIVNHIDRGDLIICAVGPGDFTANGHYIVIYGYDEKGFFINDPNSRKRSSRKWSYERLKSQIKMLWTYSLDN